MSTKSLTGLVLMVLIGTGISVYEYLESSHVPARASSTALGDRPEPDRTPSDGSRARTDRRSTFRDSGFVEQPTSGSSAEQVSECTRAAASDTPSVFEPSTVPTGS